MKKHPFYSFILPLILVFFISCSQKDCSTLPSSFASYDDAKSKILSAEFKYKDKKLNCSSSWIEEIYFFSCDGQTGYMYMITKQGKGYIHHSMPVDVWETFKNADSLGHFYNTQIKGLYRIKLK